MKNTLIRLHSIDNNGIFDVSFQEEIRIKPNSEIALQSVHFTRGEIRFKIEPEDEVITFQIDSAQGGNDQDGIALGGSKNVRLSNTIYTKNTINDLFQQMEDRFNKQLNANSLTECGVSTEIGINLNERTQITFNRNFTRHITPQFENGTIDLSFQNPGGLQETNISTANDFNFRFDAPNKSSAETLGGNYVWYDQTFTDGCGGFAFQIALNNPQGSTDNGMGLGLVEFTSANETKLNDGTLELTDMFCKLQFITANNPNDAMEYKFFNSSDINVTENTLATNMTAQYADRDTHDQLEIVLSRGKLEGRVHRNGVANYTKIGSVDYPYASDTNAGKRFFYMVYYVIGDNSTNAMHRTYGCPSIIDNDTLSQKADSNDNNRLTNANIVTIQGQNSLRSSPSLATFDQPTTTNIIFPTYKLARNLGWNSLQFNPSLTIIDPNDYINGNIKWVADNAVNLFIGTNTYLIELLNIPVNSYDSFQPKFSLNQVGMMGGRQNILQSMIVNDMGTNPQDKVFFSPNNLLFLKMNNKDTISLRTIRARLISNDYNPITIQGIAEVSLVIQEEC